MKSLEVIPYGLSLRKSQRLLCSWLWVKSKPTQILYKGNCRPPFRAQYMPLKTRKWLMFRKVCDSVHINPCLRLAKCLSTIKGGGDVKACLFKQARKLVPKDHRATETAGKIGAGALIFVPVLHLMQRECRWWIGSYVCCLVGNTVLAQR